eukprot:scaffold1.g5877.t1
MAAQAVSCSVQSPQTRPFREGAACRPRAVRAAAAVPRPQQAAAAAAAALPAALAAAPALAATEVAGQLADSGSVSLALGGGAAIVALSAALAVKKYFDTAGFERWNKIYGETEEVNKVQLDIRQGHAQTVDKVLRWLAEEGGVRGTTVCDAGCGTGSLAIPLALAGAAVSASDISAAMAGEAQRRYDAAVAAGAKAPEVAPLFEAKDLESCSGRYHTVTCLDDKADAMVSHLASLAEERLIISFAPKTLGYSILKRIGELFPGPSKATRAYLHAEADVEAALNRAGFKGGQAAALPPEARALIDGGHRCEGGFSGGHAWLFSRSHLVVWRPGGAGHAAVRELPYPSAGLRHWAAVVPGAGGRLAVVLAAEDGNVSLWPSFAEGGELATARLGGAARVTALAIGPAPAAAGSGLLAAIATEDGSVHLLRAYEGLEAAWSQLEQEGCARSRSPSPAVTAPAPGGVLARLAGLVQHASPPAGQAEAPRALPTQERAVALALLEAPTAASGGAPQLLLLVCRRTVLEGWDCGGDDGARLLWSLPLAVELGRRTGGEGALLLDLALGAPAGAGAGAAASALALASSDVGLCLAVLALPGGQQQEPPRVQRHMPLDHEPAGLAQRLHVSPAGGSGADAGAALLWQHRGAASLADLESGDLAPLAGYREVLGAAPAPGTADAWLLLDAAGLHVARAGAAGGGDPAQQQQQQEKEQEPAADVPAVFAVLQAACLGSLGAAAMAQQLAALGALRGAGPDNAIARYSRHLLDVLPKIMALGAGGGETVGEQLAEKRGKHGLLLQQLSEGGVLARLHPPVLRCLLEDGRRLGAAELEDQLIKARAKAPGAAAPATAGTGSEPFPLRDAIEAAGRACMAAVAGGGDREPWGVFYACPSVTLDAFFAQVAAAAGATGGGSLPAAATAAPQLEAVAQLARGGVLAALAGAEEQRAQQQSFFPAAAAAAASGVDGAEWQAGPGARAALRALAGACARLLPALQRLAPDRAPDCAALLFDLAERLLIAHAAAVEAAAPSERGAEKKEYDAAREATLSCLFDHAASLLRAGVPGWDVQLQRVESLAEAHGGYRQLFDVAQLTGDWPRLHQHMAVLRGDALTPPLTLYVFQEGREPRQAIVALQAYAAAGRRFQLEHRGAFAAAWARLAGATDWAEVAAARRGASDAEYRALLASQPLFQAAAVGYARGDLRGAMPASQVAALLDDAAAGWAPGAREAQAAAFQAGCAASPPPPGEELAAGGPGGGARSPEAMEA